MNLVSSTQKQIFNIDHTSSKSKIWWVILKTSIPAIILMLLTGAYLYIDELLSIKFASKNYGNIFYTKQGITYSSQKVIRLTMSLISSYTMIIEAFALLFAIGSSVMVSRKIASNDVEGARKFIKTSFKITMIVSLLLIPIMLIASGQWFEFEYHSDPFIKKQVIEMANSYIWISIIAIPLFMFNVYMADIFRSLGNVFIAMFVMAVPILVNLFFDYLLMGVFSMKIDGSAWATMIAYATSMMLILIFYWKSKSKYTSLKDLISFKGLSYKSIGLMALIGLSPLLRYGAQAMTELLEFKSVRELGNIASYSDPETPNLILSNIIPIMNIFMMILFGYIQAIAPLFSRLSQKNDQITISRIFTILVMQITVMGLILFGIFYGMSGPMLSVIGVNNDTTELKDFTMTALFIVMLSLPLFGGLVASLTHFIGIGNYWLAILVSLLRGVIFSIPLLILFRDYSLTHSTSIQFWKSLNNWNSKNIFNWSYNFWWFYPVVMVTSSATAWIISRSYITHKIITSRKVAT